jgi:hypothetical protein
MRCLLQAVLLQAQLHLIDFGRDGSDGFFGFSAAQTTFSGYKWSINAGTEAMRITNAGLFQFNSGYGSVATAYGCRAWVRFNSSTGANVINGSGNVSSVTYNSTGNYTVNFTNSMPDANYAISYNASDSAAAPLPRLSGTPTASACTLILTNFSNSVAINSTVNCVSVFR